MTQSASSASPGRATLERNKDLQCPTCCAPGVYKCDSLTRDGYTPAMISEMLQADPKMAPKAHWFMHGWPGVYVQMNDPRLNKPVGETCPNCGGRRPMRKKLNKILIKGRIF